MPLPKDKLLLTAFSVALSFSQATFAAIYPPAEPIPMPSHYWYVGGTGGVTISCNTTLDGLHTEYMTPNWDAGFEFGLEWHSFRFEAEYLYQPLNIDKVNGIDQDGGHLRVQTALFNTIFDFLNPGDVYRPYVGAGVGYAFLKYPDRDSDSELAYQAQAGIRFAVYDTASFTLGYRYVGTTEANHALGEAFGNNLINAGFIYYID